MNYTIKGKLSVSAELVKFVENELLPGSTIVVSRNPDPYNWLKLTSVLTPILSDLAISAASISAISDN